MNDQVTPQDTGRAEAEQKILEQMRLLREKASPKMLKMMQDMADAHARDTKLGQKPAKALPDDMVAYDKENAMQAIEQFIAIKKNDPAFMAKVMDLFK